MTTIHKDSQQEGELELVPWELIRSCKHRLDAIRLCVQLSDLSHEVVAESLTMDKGNFCRMMQGKANFPDAKSIDLMRVCGNYAPMQYETWACGFSLVPRRDEERIKELQREIQQLARGAI